MLLAGRGGVVEVVASPGPGYFGGEAIGASHGPGYFGGEARLGLPLAQVAFRGDAVSLGEGVGSLWGRNREGFPWPRLLSEGKPGRPVKR